MGGGKAYGIIPVAEAVGVVLGVPTNHSDKGEAEDNGDEKDFAAGEPELTLAIPFDGKEVDETGRGSALPPEFGEGKVHTHRGQCKQRRRHPAGYRLSNTSTRD